VQLQYLFYINFLLMSFTGLAQVTTSAMSGFVNDDNGEPLLAATVKATHLPSGTLNAGNLINSKWGVRKSDTNTSLF